MAKKRTRSRRGLRGAGLGQAVDTPHQLKAAVKACGSHFFDRDTQRFFNSKIQGVYPVHNRSMTYVVESIGGAGTPSPRLHRILVFKNCEIRKLGKESGGLVGKQYKSVQAAKKVARQIAAKARWTQKPR